jgi:hypothetical protein
VIEELNRTEKLEGAIEELKSLASLASSRSASSSLARQKARDNYESLARSLEREAAQVDVPLPSSRADESLGRKGAAQQQAVIARREMLNQELESAKNKVEAAAAKDREEAATEQPAQVLANAPNEWAANKDYRGKTPAQPPPQPVAAATPAGQTGANLYITDNVILQNAKTAIRDESLTKHDANAIDALLFKESAQAEEKADELKKSQASSYTDRTKIWSGSKGGKLDTYGLADVPNAPLRPGMPGSEIVLDTARSNSAVAQQQQVAGQAGQINQSATRAIGGFGGGGGLALPGLETAPQAAAVPNAPALSGAAPATTAPQPFASTQSQVHALGQMDAAWANPAQRFGQERKPASGPEREAQQQLRASGRLSLAVDFPTEGRVYHFKKLKANATLDLWLRSSETVGKSKCAFVFLVLGALIAGGTRLFARRSARGL